MKKRIRGYKSKKRRSCFADRRSLLCDFAVFPVLFYVHLKPEILGKKKYE